MLVTEFTYILHEYVCIICVYMYLYKNGYIY